MSRFSVVENAEVARILDEIADILEVQGESPFRVRAYRRAARTVDGLPEPVDELCRTGALVKLPGIGEKLAATIADVLDRGSAREHALLASKLPLGLLELLRVEPVGPKLVAAAPRYLGVVDFEGFAAAAESGELRHVPRMGPGRLEAIVAAVDRHRARQGKWLLRRGMRYGDLLAARLRAVPGVERVEVAGDVRRRVELVEELCLVAAARVPGPVVDAFLLLPEVGALFARSQTRAEAKLRMGLPVQLRVVAPAWLGAAWLWHTGSAAHRAALGARAVRKGLELREDGLFDRRGVRVAGREEADVYEACGLPFVPPELREDHGELEAAEAGRLPELIEDEDLVGDLHVHSKASADARGELDELAAEARRLGRRYLAFTEHSVSRPLGLGAEALLAQAGRVRALDRRLAGELRLLAGVEVDIKKDGSLDLPADVLAELDWVVGGVHSHFTQGEERMTERLLRAIRSGSLDAISHPTGRRLLARDAYAFDVDRVLEACAAHGVALEVNAQPDRLDLGPELIRRAIGAGVRLVVDSDAHEPGHLSHLFLGTAMARRGWASRGHVVSCEPVEALLERRRARAAPAARV